MSSRYPPQSRMPTLVPQRTEKLWYPKQKGVEHMQDELLEEEAAYENARKHIIESGSHFIPAGMSKRYMDLDEDQEEDEDEEDEEEEEDDDATINDEQSQLRAQLRAQLIPRARLELDPDSSHETENENFDVQGIYSPNFQDDLQDEERDLDEDIEEAASYATLSDRGDGDDNDDMLYPE
ncbi:hypothetical protein BGZ49_008653 [Haplosporangium sp. Z 27]|nr:hypothetical protein BGZ49_008653 [Haplosporangium sp. Z 27]